MTPTTWNPLAGAAGSTLLLLLVLGYGVRSRRPVKPPVTYTGRRQTQSDAEVRRVSVAFDARARAPLQRRLADIAEEAGNNGLPWALAEVLRELRTAHHSACAISWESGRYTTDRAVTVFDAIVASLRSRFTDMTRGAEAVALPPGLRALEEEGEGFVVVSVVAEVAGMMDALPSSVRPGVIDAALESMNPRPDALRALEVVWSPAEDEDRLSSMEMGAIYPELILLDPDAALGQRECRYCHAAYAAELGRCPSCGGPDLADENEVGERRTAKDFLEEVSCSHCPSSFAGHHYRCPSCGARRFQGAGG